MVYDFKKTICRKDFGTCRWLIQRLFQVIFFFFSSAQVAIQL